MPAAFFLLMLIIQAAHTMNIHILNSILMKPWMDKPHFAPVQVVVYD